MATDRDAGVGAQEPCGGAAGGNPGSTADPVGFEASCANVGPAAHTFTRPNAWLPTPGVHYVGDPEPIDPAALVGPALVPRCSLFGLLVALGVAQLALPPLAPNPPPKTENP